MTHSLRRLAWLVSFFFAAWTADGEMPWMAIDSSIIVGSDPGFLLAVFPDICLRSTQERYLKAYLVLHDAFCCLLRNYLGQMPVEYVVIN